MANGDNSWPALAKLVNSIPSEQRRFLRPHVEGRFDRTVDADARKLREVLDGELDEITHQELLVQSGSKQIADPRIPHFETLLQKSPAFVQYLNYYLYFGVRFAASRIPAPSNCPGPPAADSDPADCNPAPVALPARPLCRDASFDPHDLEKYLSKVVHKDRHDPCVSEALAFLDGFRQRGEDD